MDYTLIGLWATFIGTAWLVFESMISKRYSQISTIDRTIAHLGNQYGNTKRQLIALIVITFGFLLQIWGY